MNWGSAGAMEFRDKFYARMREDDTNNVTQATTNVAKYNLEQYGEVWPVNWFYDTTTTLYVLTNDDP